jgi:hypothetical protein
MRKLTGLIAFAAMVAMLCGCSKHHAGGNNYYFSFQSGAIQYTTVVDSQVRIQFNAYPTYGLISMMSLRTTEQTDSAEAGLLQLATWEFDLDSWNSGSASFVGDYTSDTGASNFKRLEPSTRFRFYTASDPHKGQYITGPGLPFTVTISQWNATWFEGTVSGQVVQYDASTGVADTATITNGKFRLPVAQ